MTPVVINKVTRKYKGPASPENPTCDPSTEEIVYGVPPSGFQNDSVDQPSHDALTGKWTGTLLTDYELSVDNIPVRKAAVVTNSLREKVLGEIISYIDTLANADLKWYPAVEQSAFSKQAEEAVTILADVGGVVDPYVKFQLYQDLLTSNGVAPTLVELTAYATAVDTKWTEFRGKLATFKTKKNALIGDPLVPSGIYALTDAELESYDVATRYSLV